MKKSTIFLVQASIIAALYAVLTIGQNLLLPGSASLAVQFRVSEVLTVLAFFMPAAIPGLTVGCLIANISSAVAGLGVYDMFFGTLATFIAVTSMYLLRNIKLKKIPILGLLMPAISNGIIIGFEIDFFFIGSMSFNFPDFLLQGGLVTLGEVLVMLILGIPFFFMIYRTSNKFYH